MAILSSDSVIFFYFKPIALGGFSICSELYQVEIFFQGVKVVGPWIHYLWGCWEWSCLGCFNIVIKCGIIIFCFEMDAFCCWSLKLLLRVGSVVWAMCSSTNWQSSMTASRYLLEYSLAQLTQVGKVSEVFVHLLDLWLDPHLMQLRSLLLWPDLLRNRNLSSLVEARESLNQAHVPNWGINLVPF